MQRVYKVNFRKYTNGTHSTVSDFSLSDWYKHNDKYIDAPRDEFLVLESDLTTIINFGDGIETMEFVGYLFDGKNNNEE